MTNIEQTYRNLDKLLAINNALQTKCFFLVFGGFALDGLLGKFTRPHKDIDMLCFRRDVESVKEGLATVGLDVTEVSHHKDPGLVYKFVSNDIHRTCTCHILDEVIDNCFEISFYHFLRQRFPLHLIAMQSVTLHNITYPIPSTGFLYLLKHQEDVLFSHLRSDSPEKKSRLKERHERVRRDIKLLTAMGGHPIDVRSS